MYSSITKNLPALGPARSPADCWQVSSPAALVIWQTQIVTDLECQYFPLVGVWVTESSSCLDQLATTTSPVLDMVI